MNIIDLQALYLSGTYCHKTGTRPPSCGTPWQPIIAVLFLFLSKLPICFFPDRPEAQSASNSIRKVTETFIFGLQEGFPATIPTICRTGDKMSQSKNRIAVAQCVLCGGYLVSYYSKRGSLNFFHLLILCFLMFHLLIWINEMEILEVWHGQNLLGA